MIAIFELPIFYTANLEEIENSSESEIEEVFEVEPTTFYLNLDKTNILTINKNDNGSTLTIDSISYRVSLDYETLKMLLKDYIS